MNINPLELFNQLKAAAEGAAALKGAVPKALITSLPANRWDRVSINGRQVAVVTEHGTSFDLGRQLGKAHWTYQFIDGGRSETIVATIDAHGAVTVSLDDDADGPHATVLEVNPRFAIRPIVVWPLQSKISVDLLFDKNGVRQDYRFDGRTYP